MSMGKRVTLNPEQRKAIGDLWQVYGNKGPSHTQGNDRWIQQLLSQQMDWRKMYKPTTECTAAVDAALEKFSTQQHTSEK